MNTAHQPHVVIIGGGITGLSAAWFIRKAAADVRITVLESGGHWGGKVITENVDGFVIEAGPDSFLTQKPWALDLARQLGLTDRLIGTNDHQRTIDVLRRGVPVPMPDGLNLIVPTRALPFLRSRLLSPWGKARIALDMLIPARRDPADESLAAFVRRRFGAEALSTLAEPLMAGIYNADPEQQSMAATFPRFQHIERAHGSLIRGLRAAQRTAARTAASTPKLPAFMSFQTGTHALIDALVTHLEGTVDLRLHTPADALERTAAGWRITLNDGDTLTADAVLITTPAYAAAPLIRPFAPDAADLLDGIRYVSSGTVSLAYRTSAIPRPLHGFGMLIPADERQPINAITVSSTKFDGRAPDGYTLLRAFFGGTRTPRTLALDDDGVVNTVREVLRRVLGIQAAPQLHRVYRWHNAQPQYDVNHLERVNAIEAALPDGMYVTGSAFRGVGLPDCVHQAQTTAARALDALQRRAVFDPQERVIT
ncbi:MAG: protoporphyrinogen oxidase [bacterium]|nr:protoporphyrinogen oxidase [bacterium]